MSPYWVDSLRNLRNLIGTEDGGDDWFKADLPEVGVTNSAENLNSAENILVHTLSISSRYEGWAAGAVERCDDKFQSRAILLHTSDGGRTWVEIPVSPGERIYHFVRFANSLVGWVFGSSGKVCRTVDGGKTWSSVLIPSGN